MVTFFIAALALNQDTAPTQPPAEPPAPSFSAPMTVPVTDRLALTPIMDGKIQPEEWDPLTSEGGVDTFFQWQPRQLHFAAILPVGKDFLISLDMKGDGWLVGSDNVEIRATWHETGVVVKTRKLDATRKSGPMWVESAELQKCVKAVANGDPASWMVEATLEDPGTSIIGKAPKAPIGLRMDALPTETVELEPYLPRVTTPVKLGYNRATDLLDGLEWKPELNGRAVVPGGNTKIRYTFKGNDELGLKRIEMRTEGVAEDATTLKAQPFPSFDRKGRAFVDYETRIADDAAEGFRLARATVQNSAGEPTILQVSYEIAPILTFDLNQPDKLKMSDREQKYRFSVYLRSNVNGRLNGTFVVEPPADWQVESGSDKDFVIYASRGSTRKAFEVTIPAGAEGVFPLRLVADFGRGKVVEKSFWISLQ